MLRKFWWLSAFSALVLCAVFAMAAGPQSPATPTSETTPALTAIAGQTMMNSHAFDYLQELSDEVGARLTGSPESARALDWGVAKMKAIGLTNVHMEPWKLSRGWSRKSAEATMLAPFHRRLTVDSMIWVGSTPQGGVEADVITVNVNQMDKELKENTGNWAGKVLLFVSKGRSSGGENFGKLNEAFRAAYAAKAVAILGGMGAPAAGMNLTHTGAVGFDTFFDIPIVSIIAEDQYQIERYLDAGKPVRIKIDVQNHITDGPVDTANVVGDIRGTEHPEQVVIVGGHLDSQDIAPGVTDDGTGVAATLAAAEAIVKSGYKPKRTIRFVLFMGEEQGLLGSLAYTKTHKDEMQNHLAALILDNGQGPVVTFDMGGRDDLIDVTKKFADSIAAFGPLRVGNQMSFGTDAGPFILAGLPGINLGQNSPEYRYTHHTVADTLDKVRPEILTRDAAIMALAAFWIADRSERYASPWPQERTLKALSDQKMDVLLKGVGLWPFADTTKNEKSQNQ